MTVQVNNGHQLNGTRIIWNDSIDKPYKSEVEWISNPVGDPYISLTPKDVVFSNINLHMKFHSLEEKTGSYGRVVTIAPTAGNSLTFRHQSNISYGWQVCTYPNPYSTYDFKIQTYDKDVTITSSDSTYAVVANGISIGSKSLVNLNGESISKIVVFNSAGEIHRMQLSEFKLSFGNIELYDLIPVKVQSNGTLVGAMYDKVSKQVFMKSGGEGDFSFGPDKRK